ncbi:MAG: metallophosphoesterase family protein [Myxococcota bacterium]
MPIRILESGSQRPARIIGRYALEVAALFRLAHVSDLHATRVRFSGLAELNAKRALGWLSWQVRRRRKYRPEIAARVIDDLVASAPDHVAVTGDLTHMGLDAEVAEAAAWLARLGPPERVTLVPGNHDAYGARLDHACMDAWRPYLNSDPGARGATRAAAPFPSLRVRGPVALVGLSSAVPTPVHLATGRVGEAQLAALPDLLRDLAARKLCRVVLVHHPPTRAHVSWRRRLEDGPALCRILARAGAELVLHGHTHRAARDAIASAHGPIPVLGVPATSSAVRARPGAYQVFSIAERGAGGYAISRELREISGVSGPLRSLGSESL